MTKRYGYDQKYRDNLMQQGFRQIGAFVPEDVLNVIDEIRDVRRLKARGDAIAAIIREWEEMKQQKKETGLT